MKNRILFLALSLVLALVPSAAAAGETVTTDLFEVTDVIKQISWEGGSYIFVKDGAILTYADPEYQSYDMFVFDLSLTDSFYSGDYGWDSISYEIDGMGAGYWGSGVETLRTNEIWGFRGYQIVVVDDTFAAALTNTSAPDAQAEDTVPAASNPNTSTPATPVEDTVTAASNPKTGDSTLIWLAVVLFALAGAGLVILRKRAFVS